MGEIMKIITPLIMIYATLSLGGCARQHAYTPLIPKVGIQECYDSDPRSRSGLKEAQTLVEADCRSELVRKCIQSDPRSKSGLKEAQTLVEADCRKRYK